MGPISAGMLMVCMLTVYWVEKLYPDKGTKMEIKKLFIHYGVNSQEKIQGCEQLMVLNRAEVCFIKAVLGTIFLPNRPLAYIPSTCQQKLGP